MSNFQDSTRFFVCAESYVSCFAVALNMPLVIIIMVFSLVVGGIGAGLATWGEATGFFKQVVSELSPKSQP